MFWLSKTILHLWNQLQFQLNIFFKSEFWNKIYYTFFQSFIIYSTMQTRGKTAKEKGRIRKVLQIILPGNNSNIYILCPDNFELQDEGKLLTLRLQMF